MSWLAKTLLRFKTIFGEVQTESNGPNLTAISMHLKLDRLSQHLQLETINCLLQLEKQLMDISTMQFIFKTYVNDMELKKSAPMNWNAKNALTSILTLNNGFNFQILNVLKTLILLLSVKPIKKQINQNVKNVQMIKLIQHSKNLVMKRANYTQILH